MKQGFGLSNLSLSYAEYCPQMCIHRISMNSQLLLLSGNSHKGIADNRNIHGNFTGNFSMPREDQALQV